MNEFWYYYIKPKCQVKAKLCYIDTDRFIINIKIEDAYQDIANDVKKWFDTSSYDVNGPLPTGKKKSYWIHKRQTRKKDYDRSCCT